MRRAGLALLLLLGSGCAYYNGMYNVKRLANRARSAEKDGRTFEAANLWGQVSTKAESVLAHHPTKSWSDEARLLQGTAYARLNDCPHALPPLETVMVASRNRDLAEQASLLVGNCRLRQGDPAGAMTAYAHLLDSEDSSVRSLARYEHGRALRAAGQLPEALNELDGTSHPRAAGERAATLAALGRSEEAEAVADSLVAAGDSLAPWPAILDALAAHDSGAVSPLVDRLAGNYGLPAALRARLLLDDAKRLLPSDSGRTDARLRQAGDLARGTPLQGAVRLAQVQAMIGRATSVAELQNAATQLSDFGDDPGPAGSVGAHLAIVAHRVITTAQATDSSTPQGDLRLFIAGEQARDSLGAGRFAEAQFRRVAVGWPASPFAPKAMLALIALDSLSADSLRSQLLSHYADNPYVTVAQGGEAPDYQALEDSLQNFASTFRPEGGGVNPLGPGVVQPARPQPRPRQPTTPRQPVDN